MANAAPLAPTLTSPPNNGYVVASEPVVFEWVFNDPGDYQAQAFVRFRKPGDADWTTMGTVVGGVGALQTFTVEGLLQPFTYEWQASTVDSGSLGSPWSPSWFFNTMADVPAPTITAPADFATITTSPVLVEWTVPDPFAQDAYRVRVLAPGGAVYYDSGVVESIGARSLMVPLAVGVGILVELVVEYRYNGYWSILAGIQVTKAILAPETPLLILTQTPGKPEMVVSITNPAASDANHLDTVANDVARNGVPIADGLAPNAEFTDRLVGAGTVDYTVTARTANGGTAQSY